MIRRVQTNDAQVIGRICRSELGYEASDTNIAKKIEKLCNDGNYFIRVFEDEQTQRILGFIQAERYDLLYGDDGWNVIALAVSREARRNGIGREMLRALEQEALKEGCRFIRLNCNIKRLDAHTFYKQCGFSCDKTQVRVIKRYFPEAEM